ncbi:hypothetical protein [uncultured Nostoc sp.]|uniref:hypothetical protein n=1 Tax=uncultured Nostoc sp. TaxID=340711 RepID=UPI0035CC5086
MTRTQVEALPHYDGKMPVDYEHEKQVRDVYRPKSIDIVFCITIESILILSISLSTDLIG